MINIFQFATADASLDYLNKIFGSMGGVIYSPSGGGGSISMLGTMFKTFNTVILAIGVLIVLYVTVVGVVATAHEGEFMGKRWNNIWIPIRMVLGVAALVPFGSGYSAIQIIMMWVIVQGIGAADTLWNTALGYVDVVGSPYAQLTIPSAGTNYALSSLFQGLVCEETARISSKDPTDSPHGGYYCQEHSDDGWCSSTNDFNKNLPFYSLGPGGQCGMLMYCNRTMACMGPNANSLGCAACQGQTDALESIIPTLRRIASRFAYVDYEYRNFYYNSYNQTENPRWTWIYDYCSSQTPSIPQSQCCVASSSGNQTCQAARPAEEEDDNTRPEGTVATSSNANFPSPNLDDYPQNPSSQAVNIYWKYAMEPTYGSGSFINVVVDNYMNSVTGKVTSYIQAQGQTGQFNDESLQAAARTGWIFAGSYYYAIAKMNNNNLAQAVPTLTMISQPPNGTSMKNYRNNYDAAITLMNAAYGNAGAFASTPQLSQFNGPFDSLMASVGQTFQTTTNPSTQSNPLSQLQTAGLVLLVIVEVVYPILLAITIALGIVGNFDIFVLGTGVTNPIGGTLILVYFFLVPAIFALLGILLSIGATLGVYVPLLPYVIFTFGAIGWLTSTIETMVAGPLVALGILSPSGQHELLGKAEPGIMLLFNVFLRPSLMIFGLIAAMLLASVVVMMINAAFWGAVFKGVLQSESKGVDPLEFVIFVGAYVSFLIAALNKCFAAIYIIPEQVMRWIGGTGERYGEEAAVSALKEGTQAASQGAKGAMEGGRAQQQASAQGAASARSNAKQAAEKKAAASTTSLTPESKGPPKGTP